MNTRKSFLRAVAVHLFILLLFKTAKSFFAVYCAISEQAWALVSFECLSSIDNPAIEMKLRSNVATDITRSGCVISCLVEIALLATLMKPVCEGNYRIHVPKIKHIIMSTSRVYSLFCNQYLVRSHHHMTCQKPY